MGSYHVWLLYHLARHHSHRNGPTGNGIPEMIVGFLLIVFALVILIALMRI